MKSKLRLTDILPILAALISVLFLLFIPSYSTLEKNIFFGPSLYVICFIVIISLFSVYLFYEIKYDHLKINRLFAILFLYLIFTNLIVSLVQPSTYTYSSSSSTISITIGSTEKWYGICCLASELIVIYYFGFIFPKKYFTLKFFSLVSIVMVSFLFVATIYSYIAESTKYMEFFENVFVKHDLSNMPDIHSFLNHHNIYGVFLVIGLYNTFFLHAKTSKHWLYAVMLFIIINIFFTSSLGGEIIALIMVFFYIVIRLIINYKNHKLTVTIISSILGALFLVFIVASIVSVITNGGFLPALNSLYNEIFNGRTSQSRMAIWNNCIELNNQNLGWAFGRGFVIYQSMLYPMNVLNNDPVFSTHNSVLALIGYGGIPMLLIFTLFVIFAVILCFKNFKGNKAIVLTILFSSLAMALYSIIETNHLIILYILFPVFLIEAKNNNEVFYEKIDRPNTAKDKLTYRISFVTTLILVFLSGFCYPLILKYGIVYIFVPILIFIVPLIVQIVGCLIKNKSMLSLKLLLIDESINYITSSLLMLLTILYMFVFNEADFAKGFLIGLMFATFTILIYMLIPYLKKKSGFVFLINDAEFRLNEKMKKQDSNL